jgi:hypothetical protein
MLKQRRYDEEGEGDSDALQYRRLGAFHVESSNSHTFSVHGRLCRFEKIIDLSKKDGFFFLQSQYIIFGQIWAHFFP